MTDVYLEHKKAKTNTEFLIQKVLSAFAFALENAATENYYRCNTGLQNGECGFNFQLNVSAVRPTSLQTLGDFSTVSTTASTPRPKSSPTSSLNSPTWSS